MTLQWSNFYIAEARNSEAEATLASRRILKLRTTKYVGKIRQFCLGNNFLYLK